MGLTKVFSQLLKKSFFIISMTTGEKNQPSRNRQCWYLCINFFSPNVGVMIGVSGSDQSITATRKKIPKKWISKTKFLRSWKPKKDLT